MLYKKSKEERLSKELFQNPTSEYRGAPFWAWNCELDKDELLWQTEQLKEMGFGGFHMHTRDGMATKYLGAEFMDLIKSCTDKAEKEGMYAYLYDEDRWPSGSAGGMVTKDRRNAQKRLIFTKNTIDDAVDFDTAYNEGKTCLLAVYDIVLNDNGELVKYSVTDDKTEISGNRWYAYLTTSAASGWFNNHPYVNTLSKQAMDKFIEITYESYKNTVGNKFGGVVPSIFTDEPQFTTKNMFEFANSEKDACLPWSTDFEDDFTKKYNISLLKHLPEVFWELTDNKISKVRYLFHDFVTERFTEAFAENCGKWCDEHNLLLTGHMVSEDALSIQTASIGEAMRAYKHFGIPGIDMLCNDKAYTTAKQCQSIVRQYGKEGMMSELYGVTNWDFDFRGHKFQGDWQAAMGVTLRVPHLSWVSMKGNAKRDYPASLNYQSPWYKEYKVIENHFARLNTALTRGKPIVKVGIIHPIESYWIHFGPKENTAKVLDVMSDNFFSLCNWMLEGVIDFDYICESVLPDCIRESSSGLQLGEMNYSAVIVSGIETMRKTTLDALSKFADNGGKVIFTGDAPKFIDAELSDDGLKLYNKSIRVQFDKTSILDALKDERTIDIIEENGVQSSKLTYQLRQDNDCEWLFITHFAEEDECKNVIIDRKRTIIVNGEFTPEIYDTETGDIRLADFEIKGGKTYITHVFYALDSLLLKLNPPTVQSNSSQSICADESGFFQPVPDEDCENDDDDNIIKTEYIFDKVSYERSEDNVLLLDLARHHVDDAPFEDIMEVQELNTFARKKLGLINNTTQPYARAEETITHSITLEYTFHSEIEFSGAFLATEDAKVCKATLNGELIDNTTHGYFTDKSIEKLKLPIIKNGENVLVITYPIGSRTAIENCFILGDFNVKCEGTTKTITQKTQTIGFGDIVSQGLPFYGANITYKTEIDIKENCAVTFKVPCFAGALVKVVVDGKERGVIYKSPYEITCSDLATGKHSVSYVFFGNRHNSFGALHLTDTKWSWFGPEAWKRYPYVSWVRKKSFPCWKYEYALKQTGILSSPIVIYKK